MQLVSRADLHCHSLASATSRLGLQRAVGLPECATPPEEVYALAKRRGMDFVTITDHDTIDGVLTIADRADVFVSEELTATFRGEPDAAVHVLCWGIDRGDHEWLQAHARDVERCAEYLRERDIAAALAHPYYFVRRPLLSRHLRILSELFDTWETRNGSRPAELNSPAAVAAELRGLRTSGGSDDHAGVDIGRTWTETTAAGDVEEFLRHLRAGAAHAAGADGDACVWAHAPVALALRTLDLDGAQAPRLSVVAQLVQRLLDDGQRRETGGGDELAPNDARDVLSGWLDAVGLGGDPAAALALLQDETAGHEALRRRALRAHERLLREAGREISRVAGGGSAVTAGHALARACIPALPYVASRSFLARERRRLRADPGTTRRHVAMVVDSLDGVDGVSRLVAQLRERGVPGWNLHVIGTDASVDRRLPTAAEIEIPFYAGRRVGVPSISALADVLTGGDFDLVHVSSPGPAGLAAAAIARMSDLPLVASHHTELARYARLRTGRADVEAVLRTALAALYSTASLVLSPTAAADGSVLNLGVEPARIGRWARGVDLETFFPGSRRREDPDTIPVLYAGRLSSEKGVGLLADAFLAAHARDPRLHLVLAGDGPEAGTLRERLGTVATFLGWQDPAQLAATYRQAAIFAFASQTDTFGQVVVEAQASGLPVIAVAEGGPLELIEHGRTGVLVRADATDVADAIVALAASPQRRHALGEAAARAAQSRTWEATIAPLAAGYDRALRGSDVGAIPAVDADAA